MKAQAGPCPKPGSWSRFRSGYGRPRGRAGRRVLQTAMRGILPAESLARRKIGFRAPFHAWVRDRLRDEMRDILASGNSSVARLCDPVVTARNSRQGITRNSQNWADESFCRVAPSSRQSARSPSALLALQNRLVYHAVKAWAAGPILWIFRPLALNPVAL
jgi:hypothetical protein